PLSIEVAARNATAERIDQQVYRVPQEDKRHLLAHLIKDGNWSQVLVFTRTKHGANRLTSRLEAAGISAAAIHGNKSQGARVRALSDFKENRITALVATEVAARGLDIKELPHVVNYELPNVPEDYVHRIGRTARAGGSGAAVSLVAPAESSLLRDIEKVLQRAIPVAALPQFSVSAHVGPARTAPSAHRGEGALPLRLRHHLQAAGRRGVRDTDRRRTQRAGNQVRAGLSRYSQAAIIPRITIRTLSKTICLTTTFPGIGCTTK